MGVGDRPANRGGPENGVVAVQDPFDFQAGFPDYFAKFIGVIAGVFTEGAFRLEVFGVNFPFQDDFGFGRDGQPAVRTGDIPDGLAADGTGNFQFTGFGVHQGAGQHQQRVTADNGDDRHLLAQFLIFL